MSEGPGLSRDRVLRAAVIIIERDGADALSMRRVAAELGAAPMSLYNYLPNKAALLDGVAELIMTDMEFAADPEADWRDQARGLARTFRAITRRYPRSVQVVITRQPRSAAGLQALELVLGAVRKAGFDNHVAVRLVRTFESFVLGSLVRESSADRKSSDLAAFTAALDRAELPHIRRLLPVLVEHDNDADFEFGLELLIDAISALRRRTEHSDG